MNGTNIMRMSYEKVVFIDSLNYFHMSLAKLPKAFGFDSAKGYFPHMWNRQEDWHYRGPLPDKVHYGHESMSSEDHQFNEWYDDLKSKNYVFDFQKEMLKYCKLDVVILRKARLAFRELFIESTGICPFQDSCTIASACNCVYRTNYLKKDTIGIIPRGGYRLADRQSSKALRWMALYEREN